MGQFLPEDKKCQKVTSTNKKDEQINLVAINLKKGSMLSLYMRMNIAYVVWFTK